MTIRETIQILEEDRRQLKEEIFKLKLEIKKLKTIKVLDTPVIEEVESQLTADVVEEQKPKRSRRRKNVESIEEPENV